MSKPKKFRILIKNAKMGKPTYMYRLGLCYQLGRDVPADLNEAAKWISAAAESGYEPAVEWMKDYAFDDDALVQSNA